MSSSLLFLGCGVKTFARCCANWFVFPMFERAQLKSGFQSGGMAIVGRLNFFDHTSLDDNSYTSTILYYELSLKVVII